MEDTCDFLAPPYSSPARHPAWAWPSPGPCLLYTSDAADEGAIVYGADISDEALKRSLDDLPRAIPLAFDIADSAAVNDAFTRVQSDQGTLGVLVNAAGVNAPNRAALEALNEENYQGCLLYTSPSPRDS